MYPSRKISRLDQTAGLARDCDAVARAVETASLRRGRIDATRTTTTSSCRISTSRSTSCMVSPMKFFDEKQDASIEFISSVLTLEEGREKEKRTRSSRRSSASRAPATARLHPPPGSVQRRWNFKLTRRFRRKSPCSCASSTAGERTR